MDFPGVTPFQTRSAGTQLMDTQENRLVANDTKPVTGDWNEAARKSEQSWDREPGKAPDAPEQSIEESMDRTEEGYGSGKDGADPQASNDGTTPVRPTG